MAQKKIKVELTPAQYSVVSGIIYEVQSKLAWDEDCKSYMDGGDLLISLDKGEYRALMSIDVL